MFKSMSCSWLFSYFAVKSIAKTASHNWYQRDKEGERKSLTLFRIGWKAFGMIQPINMYTYIKWSTHIDHIQRVELNHSTT